MVHTFSSEFQPFMTMLGSTEFQNAAKELAEQFCDPANFSNAGPCSNSTSRLCGDTTTIRIPFNKFTAAQVSVNMNSKGLLTVTGSRENVVDSKRNGQRKTTIMVEETCQLPGYLVDYSLLDKVETTFERGFLVVSLPEDPKVVEERESKKAEEKAR